MLIRHHPILQLNTSETGKGIRDKTKEISSALKLKNSELQPSVISFLQRNNIFYVTLMDATGYGNMAHGSIIRLSAAKFHEPNAMNITEVS